MTRYERAPITEAVIEFQFGEALSERDLERLRDALKARYPTIQQRLNVEVKLQGKLASPKTVPQGYQLNAANGQDAVLALQRSFATIRFAPYENWEEFVQQAKINFEVLLKVLPRPVVNRIGVRFLNRIDIPTESIVNKDINEYFNARIEFGPSIKNVYSFKFSAEVSEAETGTAMNIRVGTTSPALIDHESFIVDVDVYNDKEIPARIDDMWKTLDILRIAKNNAFESALTDKAKSLFGRRT